MYYVKRIKLKYDIIDKYDLIHSQQRMIFSRNFSFAISADLGKDFSSEFLADVT